MSGRIRTWALPLLLTLLALAVRLPELYSIPIYGEANENFLALGILEGRLPLYSQNPHIGAMSVYFVAALLALLGRHWWVVRLMPLLFGVATIPLTIRLGRRTLGPAAGLLGGLLLTGSAYHVVFTSHFAWSNSLTAFFVTAFLLLFHRSITAPDRQQELRRAIPAGLVLGMAVQTHPEAVVLAPLPILAWIIRERHPIRWLRRPAPYALGALAMVGYGNMLYYNLASRFESIRFGLSYPEYALVERYTPMSVLANYGRAVLHLARIMVGSFEQDAVGPEHLRLPLVWVLLGLTVLGMAAGLRRKEWYLPLALGCLLVGIPAMNRSYTVNTGRYLAPLFPVVCLLAGRGIGLVAGPGRPSSWAGRGRLAVGAVLAVLLTVVPLVRVASYYRECQEAGRASEPFFRLRELVDSVGLPQPAVMLDRGMGNYHSFHTYLGEDGKTATLFDWESSGPAAWDDGPLQRQIRGLRQANPDRPILMAMAPRHSRDLQERLPLARDLGSVLAIQEEGFEAEAFRLFQLAPPDQGPWANPELPITRCRASRSMRFRSTLLVAPGAPAGNPRLVLDEETGVQALWDTGGSEGLLSARWQGNRLAFEPLNRPDEGGRTSLEPAESGFAAPEGRYYVLHAGDEAGWLVDRASGLRREIRLWDGRVERPLATGSGSEFQLRITPEGQPWILWHEPEGGLRLLSSSLLLDRPWPELELAVEPLPDGTVRLLAGLTGPDRPVEMGLCVGVQAPDGTIRYAPEWDETPRSRRAHLQAGEVVDPIEILRLRSPEDPPGRYEAFALGCEPGTLHEIGPGALVTFELPAFSGGTDP